MLFTLSQLRTMFNIQTYDGKTTFGLFDQIKELLNNHKLFIQNSYTSEARIANAGLGRPVFSSLFKPLSGAQEVEFKDLETNLEKAGLEKAKKSSIYQELTRIESSLDQAAALLTFPSATTETKEMDTEASRRKAAETKPAEETTYKASESQAKLIALLNNIKEAMHYRMNEEDVVLCDFLNKDREYSYISVTNHSEAFSAYKKMDYLIQFISTVNDFEHNDKNAADLNTAVIKCSEATFPHPFIEQIYRQNEPPRHGYRSFGLGY